MNKEIIRIIKDPEGQKQYSSLCKYCFTDLVGWTDRLFPRPEKDTCWGSFKGDRLSSGLLTRYFDTRIFGTTQPMTGISAVASDPGSRNSGGVYRLLTHALKEEYAQGSLFSTLYPFSFRFYGKVGYGYLGGAVESRFEPENILFTEKPEGVFVPISRSQEEMEAIWQLYEQWISRYSFGILPVQESLEIILEWIERQKLQFYVYYREGVVRGAILFSFQPLHYASNLEIQKVFWADEEAFRAVIHFLYVHRNQVKEIVWNNPPDINPALFLKEPRFPERKFNSWMTRPLNLKKLLELKLKQKPLNGKIRFSVEDPVIKENSATYILEGEQVTAAPLSEANPIPLPLFSSLLFGGINFREASLAGLNIPESPGFTDFFTRDNTIYISEKY